MISVSDDVYEKLVRIEGKRGFSEVIRDLLRRREVLTIAFWARNEEETEKWMQSLIQA